jgi:hypothetical protein
MPLINFNIHLTVLGPHHHCYQYSIIFVTYVIYDKLMRMRNCSQFILLEGLVVISCIIIYKYDLMQIFLQKIVTKATSCSWKR